MLIAFSNLETLLIVFCRLQAFGSNVFFFKATDDLEPWPFVLRLSLKGVLFGRVPPYRQQATMLALSTWLSTLPFVTLMNFFLAI